ncbi:hypothetical protein C6376_16100 [Streptomyces sp. P3]|nr:hypothetical protein C6376_16100 [Streptomyces sp. P3]
MPVTPVPPVTPVMPAAPVTPVRLASSVTYVTSVMSVTAASPERRATAGSAALTTSWAVRSTRGSPKTTRPPRAAGLGDGYRRVTSI